MTPYVVGIDPGFSGAIALLDPGSWQEMQIHDMPTLGSTKGKTLLNHAEICRLLTPPEDTRPIAVLEKVGAMPGQGVSSMFRFGQSLGALEMALTGHGYEIFMPVPGTWKKHFKLSRDKDVSRGLACQRFPASAGSFSRKKDDGRAEAALLALWGVETVLPAMGITS